MRHRAPALSQARLPSDAAVKLVGNLMSEAKPDKRRRYPRIKVPSGMFVGWKSPGHHTVSRMQELGLGGVFVYTPKPATSGSTIELLFDVPTGEVRARATVRHVRPGVGMGLQFIQMRPEDRARLHRFLMAQVEAPDASPDKKSARPAAQPPSPTPDSTPGRPSGLLVGR